MGRDWVGRGGGRGLVLGLTYRPIPQVVFKADTVIRFQDVAPGIGDDTLLNLGVGWMF